VTGKKPGAWCRKCGRPLFAKSEVAKRECSDADACLVYKIQGVTEKPFVIGAALGEQK
jgi:hypothetical protein